MSDPRVPVTRKRLVVGLVTISIGCILLVALVIALRERQQDLALEACRSGPKGNMGGLLTSDGCLWDVQAGAEVWIDANRNGARDSGEAPMEGVCIIAFTSPATPNAEEVARQCLSTKSWSDSSGEWPRDYMLAWFPGATCPEVHFLLITPEGYDAATPLSVSGCYASFGLAPKAK